MANPEHLKNIKQGAEAWNRWRIENPSILQPDLSSANLNGASLAGANFQNVDLTRANLQGAHFEFAVFDHASLHSADLRNACLRGAFLFCAHLNGAKLNSADLREANLSFSILWKADLGNAVLWGATFNSALLTDADLTSAKLTQTVFTDVDFSEAKGLDLVQHGGPSFIGTETLLKSKGRIPKLFLRGCGVPEELIDYLPELLNNPIQFYSCFISYSHADKRFARRLHDALQGRGIRCWLDEKQMLPGDHIHKAVDEGIRLWDKVLLCCSKTSLTSWWVDKEVQKALAKEERLWKERGKQVLAIIPLNLDGHLLDRGWQDWKQEHLASRLAADFTNLENEEGKFEEQFESVVAALRADGQAREKPPKARL